MNEHSIFYYPYCSFKEQQSPLLMAAALYFDKMFILDPFKAVGGASGLGLDVGHTTEKAVKLLEEAKLIERISPHEILSEYEDQISSAIDEDMKDEEYLALCKTYGKAYQEWVVALAKVPKDKRKEEEAMQTLLKRNPGRDQNVYDEGIGVSHVLCRYAKFDLSLGESIMLNHALVGGLLKSKATPVTDDDFHAMVLEHKIRRAQRNPEIREILNDRWSSTSVAQSQLVASVFTDRGIELPCLSSNVPIESILKYRNDHDAELQAVRKELEWLVREI